MEKRLNVELLTLKVPPLVQMLVVALVMWLAARFLDTGETYSTWQGLFLIIILAAGMTVVVVGVVTLYKMGTTIDPRDPSRASKLVTVGIFSYSRNPIYLGLLVILIAWNIHLYSLYASVGLPLFIWLVTKLQIIPEEQQMGSKFGIDYFDYCEKVRRWL
ncbi:MAG: isoprenylcysteine carboxylmethyltransferase family protein [Porticoccus sp.]|nr:isoprenylcysteine carboxylmethyltransferase family protein [Porticoccus sp.]MBQ0807088.1 isoprenylcysteine carboxylmethyltransferase family protein [Porticoccus sp.]